MGYVESGESVVTAHKNERASYDQHIPTRKPDSKVSIQLKRAAQKSHAKRFHCCIPQVQTPLTPSQGPTLDILLLRYFILEFVELFRKL